MTSPKATLDMVFWSDEAKLQTLEVSAMVKQAGGCFPSAGTRAFSKRRNSPAQLWHKTSSFLLQSCRGRGS